jgi:hypothetical protein
MEVEGGLDRWGMEVGKEGWIDGVWRWVRRVG